MAKIKILLINNAYPTEQFSNRVGYIKSIIESMCKAELSVDKLVLNSDYRNIVQKLCFFLEFYNGIRVLFFPTKGESLGLVALEAMSCNVPVIGPDDFELSTFIINGVSGEKFKLNNVNSIINTFRRFEFKLKKYTPRKVIQNKYLQIYVIN